MKPYSIGDRRTTVGTGTETGGKQTRPGMYQ